VNTWTTDQLDRVGRAEELDVTTARPDGSLRAWVPMQLSPKERSLITVACLTTSGNTDQLVYHLGLAKENGATEEELIEAITHLAFYAGWPKAMAAMTVAKQVFQAA
jgi:4-carboxymuconolactone decarboxylase